MSISQNFPDEGPSLNLNFASSRILDPRITFTRTSTGTYLSNNGLVTIASANTPRFDHSYNGSNVQSLGLLIEESRTNLVTYSEQFDNAVYSKTNVGITTNTSATTAPDGSTNSEKIIESSDVGVTYHILSRSFSATSGTSYTFSIFAKAAERTKVFFGFDIGSAFSNYQYGLFDLSAGTSSIGLGSPTVSITSYPNGWYRCSVTAAATGTATAGYTLQLYTTSNGYIGNGTSGVYIWGAQVEAGAFPTSYIPTVASTVTRSADNASMTGTNFTSWYNSSEWTLVTRTSVPSSNLIASPAAVQYSSIDDGTTNNWYTIRYVTNTSSPYIDGYAKASGAPTFDFTGSSTYTFPNPVKSALAVKLNDAAFCYNGNTVETDSSVTLSTSVNRLVIGGVPKAGTISQLLYYPRRLTNTQLQNLTK